VRSVPCSLPKSANSRRVRYSVPLWPVRDRASLIALPVGALRDCCRQSRAHAREKIAHHPLRRKFLRHDGFRVQAFAAAGGGRRSDTPIIRANFHPHLERRWTWVRSSDRAHGAVECVLVTAAERGEYLFPPEDRRWVVFVAGTCATVVETFSTLCGQGDVRETDQSADLRTLPASAAGLRLGEKRGMLGGWRKKSRRLPKRWRRFRAYPE
jgi:hypothetical protein